MWKKQAAIFGIFWRMKSKIIAGYLHIFYSKILRWTTQTKSEFQSFNFEKKMMLASETAGTSTQFNNVYLIIILVTQVRAMYNINKDYAHR